MENPYSKDQILRLIERKFESAKVDYKKSYPFDEKHKREIIKDVIAMANTIDPDDSLVHDGFDGGHGFIIIGCDEEGGLFDISEDNLSDNAIQQIINEYVEPKINFTYLSFSHEIDEKSVQFGVILIAASERPPHRVKKSLQQGKEIQALRAGSCFVRIGSTTSDNVSDAELERMFEYRARSSKVEEKLQKEEFRVPEEEKNRLARIFVEPDQENIVAQAWNILKDKNFLLLVGETGVGKRSLALHFAQRLLSERLAFRLLQPSRFASLSDLRGADGSVIIIPDAFGLYRFERRDIENDMGLMHELIKNNFVILSTSDSVLEETLRDTRLEEWDLLKTNRMTLSSTVYSVETKRIMLNNHLAWAVERGRIDQKRGDELTGALGKYLKDIDFNSKLRLPLDIRRLVDDRLPEIQKITKNELEATLQDFGNLERKIQHWFVNLTADQQCFVFVLALFDGLDQKTLWDWYSLIVSRLRKLIPSLSTLPTGLMAYQTGPYVSLRAGKPTFSHPSFHDLVLKTIADVYREPFALLTDDFVKKSLPENESDEAIVRSQPMRDAIALAASRFAEYGLDDLTPILDSWASFKKGRVRIPAAMILSQAAKVNAPQRNAALGILGDWSDSDDPAKRWTSVVAYGLLHQAAPAPGIAGLKKLAADREKTVRSGVPKALKPYCQIRPADAKRLYTNLAADRDKFTRRETSRSMRTIALKDPNFILDLLDSWSKLVSKYRRWTLARTCFIVSRKFSDKRFAMLVDCMREDVTETRNALLDALMQEDLTPTDGWIIMKNLAGQHEPGSYNFPVLISALEQVDPGESWKCINSWAEPHQKRELRLAATNFLVYMKNIKPQETQALLVALSQDTDQEIALASMMDPPIEITSLDFSEDDIEDEGEVVVDNLEIDDNEILIEIIDDSQ